MTRGVPKKSRTCDHGSGILIGCPRRRRERNLPAHLIGRIRTFRIPDLAEGLGAVRPPGRIRPLGATVTEITHVLSAIEHGDPHAAERLFPLVYEELRELAAQRLTRERPGQTLQATALVHEAYLRLVDVENAQHWNGRGHFFAAAAEAMRRILVESARRKGRDKHGGGRRRVSLDGLELAVELPVERLLDLDEALTALARRDPQAAQLVQLHCFAGLPIEQAAEALGLSARTAYRDWAFARAWLYRALRGTDPPDAS
jgi:RNA polymerase sigma factor (TIGR02999 family)